MNRMAFLPRNGCFNCVVTGCARRRLAGEQFRLRPPPYGCLTCLPRNEDNPWVIAGRKQGWHLTDLQHPWRHIRARAGLDGVRIHDL